MHSVEGADEIHVPNEINPDSAEQFVQDLLQASRSDSSRVIVLTGADGVFCRGFHPTSSQAAELREHLLHLAEGLLAMRFAAKPVVAVVDGLAVGSGLGIAAATDLVISSERSTFTLPEALFGFVPAVILPLLMERMHRKDCRLWMLTGHSHSPAEALNAGLVDLVCSQKDLDKNVEQVIRQLTKTDKKAAPLIKRMTARSDLERSVRDGVQSAAAMLSNPAVNTAFRKFLEEGALPET